MDPKLLGTRQIGTRDGGGSRWEVLNEFLARLLVLELCSGWIARDLNLDNWISENSYDRIDLENSAGSSSSGARHDLVD
jgi:hypothetical protein